MEKQASSLTDVSIAAVAEPSDSSEVIEYTDGIYHGTLAQGRRVRSGLGIFAFDSSAVYFGEWKKDRFDGEGILIYPEDGGFVHGFFAKGRLNGAAFFKFANGDIYEGYWRAGKLEGNCYQYFTQRNKWVLSNFIAGSFSHVLSKGDGLPPSYVFNEITSTQAMVERYAYKTKIQSISFEDGGQYIGLVSSSGLPTGLGIFRYSDGKFDVGKYREGNLHGLCRLHLHNGDIYDGQLNRGKFQGRGVFYSSVHRSGEWIYGNFEDGKCAQVLQKGVDTQFPKRIAGEGVSECRPQLTLPAQLTLRLPSQRACEWKNTRDRQRHLASVW